MKVVGFIAEYNPFHYGHLYHLKKSKELTGSKYSIAIISGSFVQRGEPSFIDKWTKAKMAIENGIDLVIELPIIYTIQSAELFALGGISLLESLGIVDYVSFGSEVGVLEPLNLLAKLFIDEPEEYKLLLKQYLGKGFSFPMSRSKSAVEYLHNRGFSKYNYKNILESPNNILAIEYLKMLYKLKSDITPITFSRQGQSYKDEHITNTITSATAIRKKGFENEFNVIKNALPPTSFNILKEYIDKYNIFNKLDNYSKILVYLLRTVNKKRLLELMDVETGLENRLVNFAMNYNDIELIINSTATKRYPKTRIQRILINLLLNIDKETFYRLNNSHLMYIRILGMNQNGMLLLREIKKNSYIPIINRFTDYYKYNNSYLQEMILYDKIATDLFFLGLNSEQLNSGNKDFTTSPYISKNT